MKTCPRCFVILDQGHRCHGRWPRRLRHAGSATVAMVTGAFISAATITSLVTRPSWPIAAVGAVAGAIIGRAVWVATRNSSPPPQLEPRVAEPRVQQADRAAAAKSRPVEGSEYRGEWLRAEPESREAQPVPLDMRLELREEKP